MTKALAAMDGGWHAHGSQWAQARATARMETAYAQTIDDTLPALRKAAMVAGGEHSSIALAADVEPARSAASAEPALIWDPSMPVLEVPTFGAGTDAKDQAYASRASRLIASQQRASPCGWIVDLCYNGGGNVYPMLAAVTPFLTPGPIVGMSHPDRPIAVSLRGNRLYYNGKRVGVHTTITHGFSGPVAVLQGPGTASSGELTLLALSGESRVKTFGQETRGLSSWNQTVPIGSSAVVTITVGPMQDRSGKTYGGRIAPDQRTVRGEELTEARTWLKSACSTHR